MPGVSRTARPQPDPDGVLARALIHAASALGLCQKEVASIIGVSTATMSRIAAGRALEPSSKQGELALLLIRVFRSVDELLGSNERDVRAWFGAPNAHLGGIPAARVQTVEGLIHVADYLDAMRGKL